MARSRLLILSFVGLILGLALASCSLSGPNDNDVMTAFAAFTRVFASAMNNQTTSGGTLYASDPEGTCRLQYNVSNPSSITGTITLKGWDDFPSSGYVITGGTLNVTGDISGSTQSVRMTGTLSYSWSQNPLSSEQGKVTSLSFDVTNTVQNGTGSWSGTVTANGSTQVKVS